MPHKVHSHPINFSASLIQILLSIQYGTWVAAKAINGECLLPPASQATSIRFVTLYRLGFVVVFRRLFKRRKGVELRRGKWSRLCVVVEWFEEFLGGTSL